MTLFLSWLVGVFLVAGWVVAALAFKKAVEFDKNVRSFRNLNKTLSGMAETRLRYLDNYRTFVNRLDSLALAKKPLKLKTALKRAGKGLDLE